MIHEHLHQCGAVQVWQFGNLSDHTHVPEALDGFAVFAILVADQHHAVHRKLRRMQRCECKQCVIHGSQAAPRRHNHRQFEFHHQVQHELLLIDGHKHAARPFDHQPIIHQAGGHVDLAQVDFDAGPARGQIRGYRRNEFVNFIECAVCADPRQPHDRHAIRALKRAGLDGLPVNRVQRRAKKRGKNGFADARIGSGD